MLSQGELGWSDPGKEWKVTQLGTQLGYSLRLVSLHHEGGHVPESGMTEYSVSTHWSTLFRWSKTQGTLSEVLWVWKDALRFLPASRLNKTTLALYFCQAGFIYRWDLFVRYWQMISMSEESLSSTSFTCVADTVMATPPAYMYCVAEV